MQAQQAGDEKHTHHQDDHQTEDDPLEARPASITPEIFISMRPDTGTRRRARGSFGDHGQSHQVLAVTVAKRSVTVGAVLHRCHHGRGGQGGARGGRGRRDR